MMADVIDIRGRLRAGWLAEPSRLHIVAEQAYNRHKCYGEPTWVQLNWKDRQRWVDSILVVNSLEPV